MDRGTSAFFGFIVAAMLTGVLMQNRIGRIVLWGIGLSFVAARRCGDRPGLKRPSVLGRAPVRVRLRSARRPAVPWIPSDASRS